MVFGHVGRRNEYHGLAYQAELGYAACTCAADYEVGGLVGCAHVADEVHDLQHGQVGASLQLLVDGGVIVLARLPDELHAGVPDVVQMGQHALVHRPCSEASAYYEHGFLAFVKTERAQGLGLGHIVFEQSLAHRVARLDYLASREEPLHAVVGHADAVNLLGEYLVRHAGVRVLLLYQAGYAVLGTLVQRRTAGVSAHSYGRHRPELAYHVPCHALAFPDFEEHGHVFQHVLTVETAYRQAYNLVAGSRYALHLHAPQGAYKENLRVRIFGAYCVGYRHGRKDMPAGTAAADDYP